LTELRLACERAIDGLWASAPDLIAVIGAGQRTMSCESSAIGSFAGYGLPLSVRFGGGQSTAAASETRPLLPLSLTVGAWLLRDRPTSPPRVGQSVSAAANAAECAALGAALANRAARVALLVMGDGSACHGEKAPGYADERASAFDAGIVDALERVDVEALLALDPDVAGQLLAAGRPAWQVLAGAVAASGGDWTGSVPHVAAPYGVGYFVAELRRTDAATGERSADGAAGRAEDAADGERFVEAA
jgi:hypothetical protein